MTREDLQNLRPGDLLVLSKLGETFFIFEHNFSNHTFCLFSGKTSKDPALVMQGSMYKVVGFLETYEYEMDEHEMLLYFDLVSKHPGGVILL